MYLFGERDLISFFYARIIVVYNCRPTFLLSGLYDREGKMIAFAGAFMLSGAMISFAIVAREKKNQD